MSDKSLLYFIAALFGPSLVIAYGFAGIAWETIWVTYIADLMVQRFAWPYLSFVEWFAVNCIVTILTMQPRYKREPTWETFVMPWAAPVICYVVVRLALWVWG